MTTKNVKMLTEVAHTLALSVFGHDGPVKVTKLEDGGVLVTSPDGDHAHIFVSSVHFEPGEAVPF